MNREEKLADAYNRLWEKRFEIDKESELYNYSKSLEDFIKYQKAELLKFVEIGHHKLLGCDCVKSLTDSQYNRGYLRGWIDAKKIAIDIQKRIIELMKKHGSVEK